MKNYSYQDTWQKIIKYLPEHNRISKKSSPQELFMDWKGNHIHLDYYLKKDAPAKIILLHGVGGNGRLLSFIGVPLFQHGFEIIAPDLPGYGYSQVDKESINFNDWIDLVNHIILEEKRKDNRPVFLFGLSAGGMLAYHAASKNKMVEGLIATNLLDQRMQEVRDFSAGNKIISRIGTPLISLISRLNGNLTLPMKTLANMKAIVNEKNVRKILIDDDTSAGSRVPLRLVSSMINAQPAIEPEEFNICPVLLVHPEDDKWTPVYISRLFFDKINTKKELKILENAGHFPLEYPGIEQLEQYVVDFIKNNL